MTVLITERAVSRRGRSAIDQSTAIEYSWRLKGSDDLATLFTALDAEAPASVSDPVRSGTLWRNAVTWERLGPELYDFTLEYLDARKYDEKSKPETGDYRIHFDTTGGQLRITSSLETVACYDSTGAVAADNKQVIGETEDGNIEGVDIVIPAMQFSIEYTQPLATVSEAYIRTVESLTGTINNATFYGRPAGEVLFMGGSGSMGIKSDPTLSFNFVRLPNLTSQTIGDITVASKLGHHYLWILYESYETGTGADKRIAKRPKKAYVERVYQSTNFASLGIGT